MTVKVHTPEAAAKILSLKPRTIKNYLQKGIIKGIKVGNEWRIPDVDLEAYIEQLRAARDNKA